MATIKQIDSRTIHQIQSGQVIVDLCSVVKELIENSVDAGATNIEVRFKNQGLDLIEVQDNGGGISQDNYATLALKHHTSKLSTYADIGSLQTFGFRGEALASLCALSSVTVTTCLQQDAPKGTRLSFETSGKLKDTSIVAAQKGTTVSVERLFNSLPVRRRELERNIKREWHKVVTLLNQYACIRTNTKFTVSQQPTKGKRIVLFSTKGNPSTRDNIINIFGAKTMAALVSLDLNLELQPSTVSPALQSTIDTVSISKDVKVTGFVSKPTHGDGRQTPDRQMFFINGRPCGLPQFAKTFNEVYRSFNSSQSPFIFANIELDTHMYDVNVSPDKRTILLHDQMTLLENIRVSLTNLFDSQDYTVPASHPSKDSVLRPDNNSSLLNKSPTRLADFHATPEGHDVEGGVSEASPLNEDDEVPPSKQFPRETSQQSGLNIKSHSANSSRIMARWIAASQVQAQADEVESPEDRPKSSPPNDDNNSSEIEQDGQSELSARKVVLEQSPIPTIQLRRGVMKDEETDSQPPQRKRDPALISVSIGAPSKLTGFVSPQAKLSSDTPPWSPEDGSDDDSEDEDNHTQLGNNDDSDENTLSFGTALSQKFAAENRSHAQAPRRSRADLEVLSLQSTQNHRPVTQSSKTGVDPQAGSDGEPAGDCRSSVGLEIVSEQLEDTAMAANEIKSPSIKRSAVTNNHMQLLPWTHRRKDATLQLAHEVRTDERSVCSRMNYWRNYAFTQPSSTSRHLAVENLSAVDAETKLSLIISKSDFARMRIAGQFNLGFIIAVRPGLPHSDTLGGFVNDELFIIDQHASDEKYNFEKLQQSMVVQSQRLVHPKRLELTALEEEIVMQSTAAIESNGFKVDVDTDGNWSVGSRCLLTSLPLSRETTFSVSDLEELISLLGEESSESRHVPRPSKVRKMFAMRACRSSIMIGKALTHNQMFTLVSHMGDMDKPWNCPHGRPTMRHLCGISAWDNRGWQGDAEAKSMELWRSYGRGTA